MNDVQKVGLIILVLIAAIYIKINFFPSYIEKEEMTDIETKSLQEDKQEENEVIKKKKNYVNVFFIGQNDKKEEVYKAVKREKNSTESPLSFAIYALINGPTAKEKGFGVYTEIPSSTKVLSISEFTDKVIINLSSDFEQGGGTEGLYKRLFQLIKTAKRNTNRPVYLYLNNKQVDVIGGEGIMISQPLSEDFANE